MKKVFTDEVARELGYQKEVPELGDWMLGIAIALGIAVLFALVLTEKADLLEKISDALRS